MRFRVWDGERMWYPSDVRKSAWDYFEYLLSQDGQLFDKRLSSDDPPFKTDESHITMLSTGLQDKSGKEIYADDIIYWEDNDFAALYNNVPYKILVTLGCEYDFFHDLSEGLYHVDKASVIGNKHENPEWLKVASQS